MGMESYYVEILPNGVRVSVEDEIRKFYGVSNISVSEFITRLQNAQFCIKQKKEEIYVVDEAIQIQFNLNNQYIQAIVLQGCFSWFEEGLELCCRIAAYINNSILDVNISVLNESVDIDNVDFFKRNAMELYKEKYDYFKTYLADFKAKVLPSDFYDYRKKYLREKNSIIFKIPKLFK